MSETMQVSVARRATPTAVGRKSPGTPVESTSSQEPDPCAWFPSCGGAIQTVMWPAGIQPANSTGLTLVLTLTFFSGSQLITRRSVCNVEHANMSMKRWS